MKIEKPSFGKNKETETYLTQIQADCICFKYLMIMGNLTLTGLLIFLALTLK